MKFSVAIRTAMRHSIERLVLLLHFHFTSYCSICFVYAL